MYLDGIVLFSDNAEEHTDHVDHILGFRRSAFVKLKINKCFFLYQNVDYLGDIILPGCLAVSQDVKATQAIRDATFPKETMQVKSFFGACNLYRRLIKGYAERS